MRKLTRLALLPVLAAIQIAVVQAAAPQGGAAAPPAGRGGRGGRAGAPQVDQTPLPPPVEDFKPASSNQGNKPYPQINSERRARFRITAPTATSVSVGLGGNTVLTKGEDGAWTGVSRPLDEGFHYYTITIDGAQVPDPNSMYFYGSSRWGSGIEVPAYDQDFYQVKNVPHGQLRQVEYFAKTTNATRRAFVYTPPDYDKDPSRRFPVLYLQHGAGEDETGWGAQGRAPAILDNLIAEGKAKQFIVVMENSLTIGGGGGAPGAAPGRRGATGPSAEGENLFFAAAPAGPGAAPGAAPGAGGPGGGRGGRGGRGGAGGGAPGGRGGGGAGGSSGWETLLLNDLIPYVDGNFRTMADQPHRALAGLSLGGIQTKAITLAHLDTFSHIGIFSGGNIMPADVADMAVFKQKVKVVFMSYGSKESSAPRGGGTAPAGPEGAKIAADALNAAGIKAVSYVSPETAHEWQSWRRALREFAPLLFQN